MRDSHNPFTILENQISDIKKIVLEIKNTPREDYTNKYYTLQQTADLLHVDYQTIRNYIKGDMIKVDEFGPRRKLIHHFQIFNEDQSLRDFKYKRK